MKRALTLTEVVVGTIILTVVFGSLLATFVGVRRYTNHANRRLISTNLVEFKLNDLYRSVDYDLWPIAGEDLTPGTEDVGDYTIDNELYEGAAGIVVEDVGGMDYRKVTVTIDYQE